MFRIRLVDELIRAAQQGASFEIHLNSGDEVRGLFIDLDRAATQLRCDGPLLVCLGPSYQGWTVTVESDDISKVAADA